MKPSEIKPGNAFRITIAGKVHESKIEAIDSGRVITSIWPRVRGGMTRSRWWLEYERVKRDGKLIYEAPQNKRGAGRC